MSELPSIDPLDLSDGEVARRVLAMQRMAYRVEADLIGFDGIPQLRESLAELQAADETWHGAHLDATLAAAISHQVVDGVVDIHRLVVDPAFFRRGLARALVEHLHRAHLGQRFIVSTGAANAPARSLYERLGYELDRVEEIMPGLAMAFYARLPDR